MEIHNEEKKINEVLGNKNQNFLAIVNFDGTTEEFVKYILRLESEREYFRQLCNEYREIALYLQKTSQNRNKRVKQHIKKISVTKKRKK